jgi:hypothetical protein
MGSIVLPSIATSVLSPLDEVKGRMITECLGRADFTEDQVVGMVDDVIATFAHARVRSFVPILVERDVHRRLAGMTTMGAGRGTDTDTDPDLAAGGTPPVISQDSSPLDEVKDRLIHEYRGRADLTEDEVATVVDEVRASFAQPRIRSFLPILIERDVHRRLDGRATTAETGK